MKIRKRTPAQTKKWHRLFQAAAVKHLEARGAEPEEDYAGAKAYSLETPAGTLRVTIFEGWLACRFLDVGKAKEVLLVGDDRLNPYSGKWNWHFLDGTDVDFCLRWFCLTVDQI